MGGAIPAILINMPGTPDASATAIDGYLMTKKGKPLKALKMALYSSVSGDTLSDLVLISLAAPLALFVLQMGPVEIFALIIMAFALISGLIGASVTKGIIDTCLGLLIATVGLDPEHSTPRFLFGFPDLYGGFPISSVAIGALAVSVIIARIANTLKSMRPALHIPRDQTKEEKSVTLKEYLACRFVLLRGALIGIGIGIVPGIGSTAAAFMSYASARQTAKDPESFGKGDLRGIAATESANSAVGGASLIPLLTLGLPGSVSAALLIGAFLIHGLLPGPLLFEQQRQLL